MFLRIYSFFKKSNNIHDYIRRIITLLMKIHIPLTIYSKLYDIHNKHIEDKLNNLLSLTFNNVKKCRSHNINENNIRNMKKIWMFWYQGPSNMPKLIKKCILSVKRHSSGHDVILIDKNNIKNYAKLPKYIYNKLHAGDITLTHFSDILRFNLLHYYGGLWIDSTVYCVSDIPSKCFGSLYTIRQGYLKSHSNVSLGKWTGFFIGGNANQLLFSFMDQFFQNYWKHNNNLLDYFLIDYALYYAYIKNIGGFRNYVLSLTPNYYIFKMAKIGNRKCNYNDFINLTKKTFLFKLSYKTNINNKANTYYNYLLYYNK